MANETAQKPSSLWKKWLGRAFTTVMLLWMLNQAWPVWLQPGPRTTVITGPLRPDGTVDYIAALNAESSQGVTTENNAAVLLAQAFGPTLFSKIDAQAYFHDLGIESPPPDGNYLQTLELLYEKDLETRDNLYKELCQLSVTNFRLSDHPELVRWFQVNDQPLQRCLEATRRSRFYEPLIRPDGGSLVDVPFPLVHSSREVIRLLSLRVTQHLAEGRPAQALDDTKSMHRLSRLISQHPLIIPQITSYSLSAMACASDSEVINSARLSTQEARAHRDFLKSLTPFPSAAQTVDRSERYQALDYAQTYFFEPKLCVGWLQPNAFLEVINDGFDQLVDAMKLSDPTARQRSIDAVFEKYRRESKIGVNALCGLVLNPRRQFAVLVARTAFRFGSATTGAEGRWVMRADIRHEMAITGFALAEYRAVNGNWPRALDDLVPTYLDHVPIDPFSSEPLHYVVDADLNQISLYSVGENGVDDGGRDNQVDRNADDIVFGAQPK